MIKTINRHKEGIFTNDETARQLNHSSSEDAHVHRGDAHGRAHRQCFARLSHVDRAIDGPWAMMNCPRPFCIFVIYALCFEVEGRTLCHSSLVTCRFLVLSSWFYISHQEARPCQTIY